MKKIWGFLRSMRFGLILMVVILALSLAGSFIPQAREAEVYEREYGTFASIIVALGFDDMFSTWYFFLVMALLCLNLTLCSVTRLKRVKAASRRFPNMEASRESVARIDGDGAARLKTYLAKNRFKKAGGEGRNVYYKNRIGFYGSFLTHLSFLLILVFGFATLYFASVEDKAILPGESAAFKDGAIVEVLSFDMTDENGKLDYRSVIRITSPAGEVSDDAEISVNHPFSFAGRKFYQQTYATAGAIRVEENGKSEDFVLRDQCALADEKGNGVFFIAVYPGWTQNEAGGMTLITSTSGLYPDPVYSLLKMENGANTPIMAKPGERVEVGSAVFIPQAPVPYPGLRVKTSPAILLGLLYAAFILMILGLWLCFFAVPVAVTVFDDGYIITSAKAQTGLTLEIEALAG